jgi:DNA repair protein RadD
MIYNAVQPLIVPRDYQQDAEDALWDYFHHKFGHPLVLMPTGTGKSVVIASFAKRALWTYPRTRFMCVTHVETLIEQNERKMQDVWPGAPTGIYSAGLGRRDTHQPIIFAGIQSVYERAAEFGFINLLFIDEAHLVSPTDETMYRAFIAALLLVNPKLKVVGLTATGWRLKVGSLVGGGIFTDVAIDMTTPGAWNWFVDNGYLSRLTSRRARTHLDATGISTVGGEYNMKEMEKKFDNEQLNRACVEEMMWRFEDRSCWMVFATGVNHCEHVADVLNEMGVPAVAIHSKSKKPDQLIEAFKHGEYRAAVSMNKLTTGVDIPHIDAIGVMRRTKSSSLWVQMLGRGTRPCYADGYDLTCPHGRLAAMAASRKPHGCDVADFVRNTEDLGPINDPVIPDKAKKKKNGAGGAVMKACPVCDAYCGASARFCVCGHEFVSNVKLDPNGSDAEVMTRGPAQEEPVVTEFDVTHVTYHPFKSRVGNRPPALRVTYYTNNMLKKFDEYINFEDDSGRTRAFNWWNERVPPEYRAHMPMPDRTDVAHHHSQWLRIPKKIRVWTNLKKPRIMSYEY